MMVLALLAASLPAVTAPAYVAPTGPLILTRTLQRALPGGKEIVATRRYELRIVRDGEGYRVEGRLLTATVEAPPSLDALAAIERGRSDAGLFPFRLDARGRVASPAFPTDRSAAAAAGAALRRTLSAAPIGPAEREQAAAFTDAVVVRAAAASGAKWPDDLFDPVLGTRSTSEELSSPSGNCRVTTTITASRSGETSSIERTVVTRMGGQERTTREIYRLSPATS